MALFIETIEFCLCLEEFLKDKRGFPVSILDKLDLYIREMMLLFRFVVDRKDGKGLNLVKIHMLQHL